MAYPQLDADHVAQWDLKEQPEDLEPMVAGVTEDNLNVPPRWRLYRPFVDDVGGEAGPNSLTLYDYFPLSSDSKYYTIGGPGPVGGSVTFQRGSATASRDYLFGATTVEPDDLTIDMWVMPFAWQFVRNLIQKEISATTWASPYVAAQLYTTVTAPGTWGATVAIGTTQYHVTNIGAPDVSSHIRMRIGLWNHIGLTFDGLALRAHINGYLAGTTACEGSINYGAGGGNWVIGPNRVAGGMDFPNAAIGRTRISQIARPTSYFFDSYQGFMSEIAGGGAGPGPG